MVIRQSTDRGIVNWNSYSVGAGARVDYHQPSATSATSATLNRVTGDAPSTIAGQINANGRVFVVNPNGIQITRSGTVNTAGFVASTHDIKNGDFLEGRYRFEGGGSSQGVVNRGRIKAKPGGFVGLVGGRVANEGSIEAPGGKVGLGAGEQVTVDVEGDGFLSVSVPSGDAYKLHALVKHSGRIRADGGAVEMRAATSADAARAAVNVTGRVEARGVSRNGAGLTFGSAAGRVVIDGGSGGAVRVSGSIDTSSRTGDVAWLCADRRLRSRA
jgi:filamentous hemagglutinin family protein